MNEKKSEKIKYFYHIQFSCQPNSYIENFETEKIDKIKNETESHGVAITEASLPMHHIIQHVQTTEPCMYWIFNAAVIPESTLVFGGILEMQSP